MPATVLLVEDDQDIREVVTSALDFEQYEVVACEDGKSAVRVLMKGLRPHAILLDLMMPRMNGFEFLEAIRRFELFARIPVIVASANSTYSAEDLGVMRKLRKPYDLLELLRVVREAVVLKEQRDADA